MAEPFNRGRLFCFFFGEAKKKRLIHTLIYYCKNAVGMNQNRLGELGLFSYETDGFTYQFKTCKQKIRWDEITAVVAYKVDLYTIDEIRMDVVVGEYQFTIGEETPGWFQFVERMKQALPSIPKDWDATITKPAFVANRTMLFERQEQDAGLGPA